MSDFSRFQPQGFYGGEDGKEKELGYDPKYDHTSHYAQVSSVLGITAIAANFFLPVVLPIALGSLSKLPAEARRGATFALTAIILNLILTVSSLYTTYESLQDPIRRAQISETLKQIYGISLEDAVSDFDAAFAPPRILPLLIPPQPRRSPPMGRRRQRRSPEPQALPFFPTEVSTKWRCWHDASRDLLRPQGKRPVRAGRAPWHRLWRHCHLPACLLPSDPDGFQRLLRERCALLCALRAHDLADPDLRRGLLLRPLPDLHELAVRTEGGVPGPVCRLSREHQHDPRDPGGSLRGRSSWVPSLPCTCS